MQDLIYRPDDPRLGEVIERWDGGVLALQPGRVVILGFPQDEGVRRNHGRTGAAQAPAAIRRGLGRLTPWDAELNCSLCPVPPLDIGDVMVQGGLEASQEALGEVVAGVLAAQAIPIVLGGGHETAYGVYLGHVARGRPVGIINIDAHLDVRPLLDGRGHSGSPFRQAMEHARQPLPGRRYVCLGAQPQANAQSHVRYATEHGCVIHWCNTVRGSLAEALAREAHRLAGEGCAVHVTIDADAVRMADVPGVSAPNPTGLSGDDVILAARRAGQSAHVSSLDLVEINPTLDRDGQSARWAAVLVWNFMMGVRERQG